MTDIQLLTIVLTLLAIFAGIYLNRKSVEDMRDVLRAESKVQTTQIERSALQNTAGCSYNALHEGQQTWRDADDTKRRLPS